MSRLRVRAYNVRFGDAIFVSVPERQADGTEVVRHILFDVGNVLVGVGGVDPVFEAAVDDILAELDGNPLDLYVMTHEHMDHVQGLPFAAEQLGKKVAAMFAWLPASAAPDYYVRHPDAKKRRVALEAAFDGVSRFYAASPEAASPVVRSLMLNNDYRSTSKNVDFLRTLTPSPDQTFYVHRELDIAAKHPFTEAKLSIWAPEEDTTAYYGAFRPMALAVTEPASGRGSPTLNVPLPPPGVDAGAFYHLVDVRRSGVMDNLLGIDAANNNTSVVVCLEWRGFKLLFPGDAEQRSWKEMNRQGKLEPVHFLKVGHHGSSNGTAPPELLDKVLPPNPPDKKPRKAIVSTCVGPYHDVPHTGTLDLIRTRCELQMVGEATQPSFVDVEFDGA
jgi:beta-lactamase superfamily II metal-dependent hydrolase